jgi:hypothetical protein
MRSSLLCGRLLLIACAALVVRGAPGAGRRHLAGASGAGTESGAGFAAAFDGVSGQYGITDQLRGEAAERLGSTAELTVELWLKVHRGTTKWSGSPFSIDLAESILCPFSVVSPSLYLFSVYLHSDLTRQEQVRARVVRVRSCGARTPRTPAKPADEPCVHPSHTAVAPWCGWGRPIMGAPLCRLARSLARPLASVPAGRWRAARPPGARPGTWRFRRTASAGARRPCFSMGFTFGWAWCPPPPP